MKVAVIGYGLIGRERVRALVRLREEGIVSSFAVHDPFAAAEQAKVEGLGGAWCAALADVRAYQPDWVVIATPHDTAVELCIEVLGWAERVLMEKPFGRSLAEAEKLRAASWGVKRRLHVGFNYRFFPGISAALIDARAKRFGELVSVNMVIGHGGSPGMEKGWKFDPIKAGGGCLIDPGIHLLDLCHCLAPDVSLESIHAWSGFWKTGIEEETHLLLRSGRTIFNVQVSVVRWRSVFRLELHGTEGYGIVTGRGRSYGPMKYVRGRRWGWQNAANQEASEETVNVSECDDSFVDEMRVLFSGTWEPVLAPCTAAEALEVMRLYETCKTRL
ncbi:MAG: Gfo/Idh/MocA family oxidoreductase [Chthoniobacter sp.]|uniref:Gfo/Idh/MocA family protein n=1 Tax=Chthoniobacter sp. TaxID=2510640 RepID=UPI0032A56AEF